MSALPTHADAVVIGAGFAGLSTAAALAEAGAASVVVLDAESHLGVHSSGRNAAMARQVIEDPVLTRLAHESVTAMRELRDAGGFEVLDQRGGLLVGSNEDVDALMVAAGGLPRLADSLRRLEPSELTSRWPALRGATLEAGVLSPSCGVADPHALLTLLSARARSRGGLVQLGVRVTGIQRDRAGVASVSTSHGPIATRTVINAAGFAANTIASYADCPPLALTPVRRHLHVTTANALLPRNAPFIWDVSAGWYVRPEGDGLLMCACDETPWFDGDCPTDPGAREHLAAHFSHAVPGLSDARPARGWAGLRVMTPDGRFAVGADGTLEGFWWVAGLGGHGMTTSLAVGRVAAALVSGLSVDDDITSALSPRRSALIADT